MKSHLAKYEILYLLIIIAATIMLYFPSLSNSFVWDDTTLIKNNSALRAPSPLHLLKQPFWPPALVGKNLYYRPMSVFWFWLGYKFWKISPLGYRLENLAVYLIVIILLYFFMKRKLGMRTALIGAAIFAAHPVHIENAAFISGITDLSAGLFFMSTFLLWTSEKKKLRYFMAPILYFLSLLSKEVAVMGIVVIILYDVIFRRKKERNIWAGWLALFAALPIYFAMRYIALGHFLKASEAKITMIRRLLFAPYILLRYIQNSIIPIDLKPYHPEKLLDMSISTGIIFWIVLIILIYLALKLLNNKRYINFGILWFILFLLPVLGIVNIPSSMWAERFLFIPSVGFAIVAAVLFEKLLRADIKFAKRLPKILLSGYIVFLALFTFTYSYYWRNDWILSRYIVDTAPDMPIGYAGLAHQFFNFNEPDSAYFYSVKSLEKDSIYFVALNIISGALLKKGEVDSSIFYLKKLVGHYPYFAPGYINLGRCLLEKGDAALGVKYFAKALTLAPRDARTNLNYGLGLIVLGDTLKGIKFLRKACIYHPEGTHAPSELANLYFSIGDSASAKEVIEQFPQIRKFYIAADTTSLEGGN